MLAQSNSIFDFVDSKFSHLVLDEKVRSSTCYRRLLAAKAENN